MSFKMAGRIAFRKGMETAKPCLLEPIMKVEIEAPDEFAGTLMGDLSSRRGRVQGTDSKGRTTLINAQVPMAEMLTYGTLLTSMTPVSSRQNPSQRQASRGGRGRIIAINEGSQA
jgi:elongation factor G